MLLVLFVPNLGWRKKTNFLTGALALLILEERMLGVRRSDLARDNSYESILYSILCCELKI